jgi:hypothetical protein
VPITVQAVLELAQGDPKRYSALQAKAQFQRVGADFYEQHAPEAVRLMNVVRSALDTLLPPTLRRDDGADAQVFLHVPADPRELPLPVTVLAFRAEVAEGTEREQLLRATAWVEHPRAVEPPAVEAFASPLLGEGLRTLRHESDGGRRWGRRQELTTVLVHAFVAEGLAVQASTTTPHSRQLYAALPDLDAFARTLAPNEAPAPNEAD